MSRVEFTCPSCGSHKLEEIMSNVTVVSEVDAIESLADGEVVVDYGDQCNHDGEVDGYQCAGCGESISIGRLDLSLDNPAFTVIEDTSDEEGGKIVQALMRWGVVGAADMTLEEAINGSQNVRGWKNMTDSEKELATKAHQHLCAEDE